MKIKKMIADAVNECEKINIPPRGRRPADNYRIIKIDKDPGLVFGFRKITVKYFKAKDNEQAFVRLQKFIDSARKKGDNTEYFWDYANRIIGADGEYRDDIVEDLRNRRKTAKTEKRNEYEFNFYISLFKNGSKIDGKDYSRKFSVGNYRKSDQDMKYCFDDFEYLISNYSRLSSTTHNRSEHWSIDGHIISDLIFNIPLLIKNKSSYPSEYELKAFKKFGIDPKSRKIDPDKRKQIDDEAVRMWNAELEKLLLYVRLYEFYASFGISEDKEFENKYKSTVPYYRGSYNCIDYPELHKLTMKYWKLWIHEFEKIGQSMWD